MTDGRPSTAALDSSFSVHTSKGHDKHCFPWFIDYPWAVGMTPEKREKNAICWQVIRICKLPCSILILFSEEDSKRPSNNGTHGPLCPEQVQHACYTLIFPALQMKPLACFQLRLSFWIPEVVGIAPYTVSGVKLSSNMPRETRCSVVD